MPDGAAAVGDSADAPPISSENRVDAA